MSGAGITDGDLVVVDSSVEAVPGHVVVAVVAGEKKLRARGLAAGRRLAAFLHTDPHKEGPRHHGARSTGLAPMTADTRELVAAAEPVRRGRLVGRRLRLRQGGGGPRRSPAGRPARRRRGCSIRRGSGRRR